MALLTFEPELPGQFAPGAESLFLNSADCAVFPVFDARSPSQNNKGSRLREFQHRWATSTGCAEFFVAVRLLNSNEKRPIRRRSHPRLTNLVKGFDAAVCQNDFTSSMTRQPSRFPSSPPETDRSEALASPRAHRVSGRDRSLKTCKQPIEPASPPGNRARRSAATLDRLAQYVAK